MQILLADDDPISNLLLRQRLEAAGFSVVVVDNGADAIRRIQHHMQRLDARLIAILDWEMPDLQGVDIVEWIRRSGYETRVYALLHTSRSHTSDVVEGLGHGAEHLVSKPYQPDELLARIEVGMQKLRGSHEGLTLYFTRRLDRVARCLVDGLLVSLGELLGRDVGGEVVEHRSCADGSLLRVRTIFTADLLLFAKLMHEGLSPLRASGGAVTAALQVLGEPLCALKGALDRSRSAWWQRQHDGQVVEQDLAAALSSLGALPQAIEAGRAGPYVSFEGPVSDAAVPALVSLLVSLLSDAELEPWLSGFLGGAAVRSGLTEPSSMSRSAREIAETLRAEGGAAPALAALRQMHSEHAASIDKVAVLWGA